MSDVPPPEGRTPIEAGRYVICGQPVPGRRQACSPRCRVAQWRRDREREHTATVARLQAETARLRQRVAELENLVGQLKTRLSPRAW